MPSMGLMPLRKKENLMPDKKTSITTKARIMALVTRLLAQKIIKRKKNAEKKIKKKKKIIENKRKRIKKKKKTWEMKQKAQMHNLYKKEEGWKNEQK